MSAARSSAWAAAAPAGSVTAARDLVIGQLDRHHPLTVLRVLVVGYAVVYLALRLPHLWDVAALGDAAPARWEPVGPLVWWDAPWPATGVRVLVVATLGLGLMALAGVAWRVTGPAVAVGVLLVTSYRSSWGQIFHTENLLVLHLLVLAAAAVVDGDRPGRRSGDLAPRAMVVVLAVSYVLAGWAKIRLGGIDWVTGDVLRHHVAHDNLRKVLVGDWHSPLGAWAVAHGWVFPPLAGASLLVELGGPLALLGGHLRRVWVAGAWLFHVGVVALMAIVFPYQLSGVAFACCWAARPLRRRRRSPSVVP